MPVTKSNDFIGVGGKSICHPYTLKGGYMKLLKSIITWVSIIAVVGACVALTVIIAKPVNATSGQNGSNGLSAYDIAVNNGFVGTETEWLASLHGNNGQNGISAIRSMNVVVETALYDTVYIKLPLSYFNENVTADYGELLGEMTAGRVAEILYGMGYNSAANVLPVDIVPNMTALSPMFSGVWSKYQNNEYKLQYQHSYFANDTITYTSFNYASDILPYIKITSKYETSSVDTYTLQVKDGGILSPKNFQFTMEITHGTTLDITQIPQMLYNNGHISGATATAAFGYYSVNTLITGVLNNTNSNTYLRVTTLGLKTFNTDISTGTCNAYMV
jgi:hypothetical protein